MERVLFVDDEPNVLEGIRRGLRNRVELHTATSGAEGLTVLRDAGPFAVVVSDMRMPAMTGSQFVAEARALCPDTVRMMLSGQSDLEATIAAVNEGRIFRFLSKPCSSDQLWAAVEAGIEQYRLITAEKVLLEQTLAGAVKMLVEVLGIVSPAAYGRASRLRRYVDAMTSAIGLPDRWQIPLAALVSQIGCVTLPKDTVSKADAGQALSDDEKILYESHPEVAAKLLAAIPRLEDVAAIVAGQRRLPDVGSLPADLAKWDICLLGQTLLYAAGEFDRRIVSGVSRADAIEALRSPRAGVPVAMVDALRAMPRGPSQTVRRMIGLKDLASGMVFDEDLYTTKGVRLVPSGQEVTASLLVRLRAIASGVGVIEPFRVLVAT
jgi:response regulator RpfG family c-di-GMP phosphodiesterase